MIPSNPTSQETFFRTREDPFFAGLIRHVDVSTDQKVPTFDLESDNETHNISRSVSDIGYEGTLVSDIFDKSIDSNFNDLDSADKPKIAKTASFDFANLKQPELTFDDDDDKSSPKSLDPENYFQIVPVQERHVYEKTYGVYRRKSTNLSEFPHLPQSAASFYNGFLPLVEIVESCESVETLNLYLKARKDDVTAGVPGKFLHVVIGQDGDVGSVASTIMYAFYQNDTLKNDQLCIVPVINMKRADFSSRTELKWLLDSCQIDDSSFIFADEIDLSYFDLFGSLKIVLLNGHKLPSKQEALKEAVVEVFNCRKGESAYPWVETITVAQDASCCTLVAEKFVVTFPEILTAQGFSKLLLAGILMDTENLSSPLCTNKDKYISTLLINGAGRYGCNGFYQMLRHKMYDVSTLKVIDILRKEFKKWARLGKGYVVGSRSMVSYIGLSSIGISVQQLLVHSKTAVEEIRYFQQLEKLRLLMVVSGYYDSHKSFKREILITAESVELMKNLLIFLNSNSSQLPLKVLHHPGLRDEMRVFEVDKPTSRKTIQRLLEEFGGGSKASA